MLFKPRSHGVSALTLLCVLLIGRSDGYADQTNVELLVDDSGSMAQRIEGKTKVAIAKEVLSGLVQDLPPDAQIAVRTYGRQKSYQARDCTDMELNDALRAEHAKPRITWCSKRCVPME